MTGLILEDKAHDKAVKLLNDIGLIIKHFKEFDGDSFDKSDVGDIVRRLAEKYGQKATDAAIYLILEDSKEILLFNAILKIDNRSKYLSPCEISDDLSPKANKLIREHYDHLDAREYPYWT